MGKGTPPSTGRVGLGTDPGGGVVADDVAARRPDGEKEPFVFACAPRFPLLLS